MESFDYESPLPDLAVEGSGYIGALDIPHGPDPVGPSQERLRVDAGFRAQGGDQLRLAGGAHNQTDGPGSARQSPVRANLKTRAIMDLEASR